jgi:CheY-like chemotaxis protein
VTSGVNGNILIVDDEPDIRDSLKDILEAEGYAVTTAANGREGLLLLPKLVRPCAVILDIFMPVMSGTELYAAMQRDPAVAKIPVLVSTSDPLRAPSGTLIMKKPVNLERLLQALRALCVS